MALSENLLHHDQEMNEHLQGRVVNNHRAGDTEGAREASEVLLFATKRLMSEGNINATMRKYKVIAEISNKVHGKPDNK